MPNDAQLATLPFNPAVDLDLARCLAAYVFDASWDPAIIYVRKSNAKKDARIPGMGRQMEDAVAYCFAERIRPVAIFFDIKSAWVGPLGKTKPRPGLKAGLDGLKAGTGKHLVVWRLDRATRAGIRGVMELIKPIEEAGAFLRSTDEDEEIDTSTEDGLQRLLTLASQAKKESDNTSKRVKRARKGEAELGVFPVTGKRAFSRTKTGELVDDEAALLLEAKERILRKTDPDGSATIAKDWNKRGITTTTGGPWDPQVLKRCILHPLHAGLRVYNGVSYEGKWTPLWDINTLAALESALDRRSFSFVGRRKYPIALLSSAIIRCFICKQGMRPSQNGGKAGGYRRYSCIPAAGRKNCGRVHVGMKGMDAHIGRVLSQPLAAAPELDAPVRRGRTTTEIQRDIDLEIHEMQKLAHARHVERRPDLQRDAVYNPIYQAIEDRVQELTKELEAAGDTEAAEVDLPPLKDPGEWWDGMTPEERRKHADSALLKVWVYPATRLGKGFDERRVDVKMKHGWLLKAAERAARLNPPSEEAASAQQDVWNREEDQRDVDDAGGVKA